MTRNIPPKIFDGARIGQNIFRHTGESHFVTDLIIDDLTERLAMVKRPFKRAIIAGPVGHALPGHLRSAQGEIDFVRAGRLVDQAAPERARDLFEGHEGPFDLIVSVLDLGGINDLAGMLVRIRRALVADGLFLGALVGGNSLSAMRQAWIEADSEAYGGAYGRVAPMLDIRDAGALLQRAGFALPVVDVENHQLRHAGGLAAMADIKSQGGANPLVDRPKTMVTRTHLARAAAVYERIAGDSEGRCVMGLDVIWMSGWAPHESQQKPLRPGSARQSLRDVLGDKS
jgi:hypothetical protein